jgi:hypothetical protein
MTVRSVLGAGNGRLFHQLLTEGLVLALAGGLLGTALGWAACVAARSVTLRSDAPLRLDFSFDWHVVVFALGSTLLVGLAAATAPALRISHHNLNFAIHGAGHTTGRDSLLRMSLVMAQLAGAMALLVVTGLFAKSLRTAEQQDLGFVSDHVINVSMDPLLVGYSKAQGTEFLGALLERIREMPGVVSAGIAYSAPMSYVAIGDALTIHDYIQPPDQPRQRAFYNTVSPDYFATLRIPIRRGRAFTNADDEHAGHVAIVNEAFARRYWPGREAIGRTLQWSPILPTWSALLGWPRMSDIGASRVQSYRTSMYPSPSGPEMTPGLSFTCVPVALPNRRSPALSAFSVLLRAASPSGICRPCSKLSIH